MTDAEVFRWLFSTGVFSKACNWPVHVDGLLESKRELHAAVQRKQAADDVCRAYEKLAGAIGPTVMTSLLQADDAFPEVNHSDKPTPPSPGKVTLYVDPSGQRVLAEFFSVWGKAPVFTVEAKR
jgi:hypothetical protein